METTSKTKRQFIVGLLLAAFIPSIAKAARRTGGSAGTGQCSGLLVGAINGPESAQAIGRQALAEAAALANSVALVDVLIQRLSFGESEGEFTITSLSRGELRGRIDSAIRQDFDKARTLDVDGWVLSETEVNLCALTAIYEDADGPASA